MDASLKYTMGKREQTNHIIDLRGVHLIIHYYDRIKKEAELILKL